MAKKEVPYERSTELRRTFNELAERWCKKHRLGLPELAERCGVSSQYLSHIGRYGRIPSKPILTLLAFNLEVPDPETLFRMAGIRETWPYEQGVGLRPPSPTDSGLLSVSLDMGGFASVIRDIVRAEVQPKRLEDLLGGRPLRAGMNRAQFFLFERENTKDPEGVFPELMRAIALALNTTIEFVDVSHAHFHNKLESGAIDCYGPIYKTVTRLSRCLYSRSFCAVPAAVLRRTKRVSALIEVPEPKRFSDLRQAPYVIAVHNESMAHHFATTVLGIPEHRLIPCEHPDEALERVLLAKLPRPAHLMLTDLPFASWAMKEHAPAISIPLAKSGDEMPRFEDVIAVRPDWPPLLNAIDQALDFLRKNDAIKRIADRGRQQHQDLIELPA